jgi:hypothetical protein
MFAEMSPWSIFAEEERHQVVTLFNRRRFGAVREIIENCARELPLQIDHYFHFVRPLAEGFLFWEQFNHKTAFRRLEKGFQELEDYLKAYPVGDLKTFQGQVKDSRLGFVGHERSDSGRFLTPADLISTSYLA